MAKSGKSTEEIQDLLKEKQQIERWLERLENAADQTAADVRTRVGKDYRTRLDGVVGKLQGYRDELTATLGEQHERRAELESGEAAASERLSEVELRHAVGEYDEATYSSMRTDILEELVGIRGDLKVVRGEIETLDGVIRQIDAPPPSDESVDDAPEPEAAPAESAAEAEPRLSLEVPEIPAESPSSEPAAEADEAPVDEAVPEAVETPGDADGAAGEPEPPADEAESGDFDELAFLKSVTETTQEGGAGAAADAKYGKPKKTLVCSECGANNLPTEWYCERCGAELAAL